MPPIGPTAAVYHNCQDSNPHFREIRPGGVQSDPSPHGSAVVRSEVNARRNSAVERPLYARPTGPTRAGSLKPSHQFLLPPVGQKNKQVARADRAVAIEIGRAVVTITARPPVGEEIGCADIVVAVEVRIGPVAVAS